MARISSDYPLQDGDTVAVPARISHVGADGLLTIEVGDFSRLTTIDRKHVLGLVSRSWRPGERVQMRDARDNRKGVVRATCGEFVWVEADGTGVFVTVHSTELILRPPPPEQPPAAPEIVPDADDVSAADVPTPFF